MRNATVIRTTTPIEIIAHNGKSNFPILSCYIVTSYLCQSSFSGSASSKINTLVGRFVDRKKGFGWFSKDGLGDGNDALPF